MKYNQVRSSIEKGMHPDYPSPNRNHHNPPYKPSNYNQPHSIHHDRSDDDNPRQNGRYPQQPYPPNPYGGYAMPQFIPIFMPMGGYPGMQPYGYPGFPQQYHYGQQYDDEIHPDDVDPETFGRRVKPQKLKTAEEIIADFKLKTLPRLHMSRLVKMQALMKGHHVRKFKMPKIRKMDKVTRLIAKDILNVFLEDQFIPDIALEIITMNKYERDYTMHETKTRAKLEYIDEMVDRIVRVFARDAARETANNLAYEFLKMKKGEPLVIDIDPFSNCAKEVLHKYVAKISEQIAKESVQDMVMEYLMESQLTYLLKTKYLPKICEEVAHDGVLEVACEEIIHDKIGRMVEDVAPAMIDAVYEELVTEATDKELEKAAKNHVRRLLMDALLDNLRAMVISKAGYEEIADRAVRDGAHSYLDEEQGLEIHEK